MLVRFTKRTIVEGTIYEAGAEEDIANDLADQVVNDGNGVVVGLGSVSREAQWNDDNTALKHPVTGADVPISGDSVLSVCQLVYSADTVVNSGSAVAPNTVMRNDLGLTISGGAIYLPSGVTQFRFGYLVLTNVAGTGTYRQVTPDIWSGGVNETNSLLGTMETVVHTPSGTLTYATTKSVTLSNATPWVDVTNLATPLTGVAGDDKVSLFLTHNAGAGVLSLMAGTTFWLETLTPST